MWEQGVVVRDDGQVIAKPGMTISELLAVNPVPEDRISNTGPGYRVVNLGLIEIGGNTCYFMVYFRQDTISSLYFGVDSNSLKVLCNTEIAIPMLDQELNLYKDWVMRELGRKDSRIKSLIKGLFRKNDYVVYKYPWGRIGAGIDHWHLVPYIWIRYN
jgi:hypothetical protein